jgi:twitching motility two-component system response regulator PilG
MDAPLILAVDDSPTIRKIVEVTLRSARYRVRVAGSALEALAAVAEEPPALIVLDIMLARMNGFQVCALIKQRSGYAHIPIVLLSGKTSVDDKVNGWIVGCAGYITKPFEPQRLLEVIQRHVPAPDAVLIGGKTHGSTDPGR